MVRTPYFDSTGIKRGAWSEEEDNKLRDYIQRYGHHNWRLLPMFAGLARCGKSCRLRWMNYLKPGLKRGKFTKHERDLIIKLHAQLGNKWSAIAENLPGRTDNEVKNYWHAHIQKRNKRNSPVSKLAVIKNQMLKEDRPSQINICNIPTNQTGTPSNNVNIPTSLSVENLGNIDVVNLAAQADQGNNIMTEGYYQTCREDLPDLFAVEDYHDNFWFCQEMQNDISVLSAESQLRNFWAEPFGEEGNFMVLW